MAVIIDGKALAAEVDQDTKKQVDSLLKRGLEPHLVVILVGDNEASQIYVRNKSRRAEKLGIKSTVIKLVADTSEQDLLDQIEKLNDDDSVHAILVQMPLPAQINEFKVIETISPKKDADGFNPVNVGRLSAGQMDHTPVACTPKGIMKMLEKYQVNVDGKNVVIVGRSNIVGKPMSYLLLNANATVTVAHSHTANLKQLTKTADILVVAVGKTHFIKGQDIKDDAVVIDVGMDRDENGKLTGDVEFSSADKVASFITPVPKGVGPMTISMLMQQTVELAKWSKE